MAARPLLLKPAATVSAPTGDKAQPAPRGTVRLWLTLGLIGTLMTLAAQQPKALLPMALACLCVLVRTGCLTLTEAWSAVSGPVLLSIALSFALGDAIAKSGLAEIAAGGIVQARRACPLHAAALCMSTGMFTGLATCA